MSVKTYAISLGGALGQADDAESAVKALLKQLTAKSTLRVCIVEFGVKTGEHKHFSVAWDGSEATEESVDESHAYIMSDPGLLS